MLSQGSSAVQLLRFWFPRCPARSSRPDAAEQLPDSPAVSARCSRHLVSMLCTEGPQPRVPHGRLLSAVSGSSLLCALCLGAALQPSPLLCAGRLSTQSAGRRGAGSPPTAPLPAQRCSAPSSARSSAFHTQHAPQTLQPSLVPGSSSGWDACVCAPRPLSAP